MPNLARSRKLLAAVGVIALWGVLLMLAFLPGMGVAARKEGTGQTAADAPQALPLTWLPSRTDGFDHTAHAVAAVVEYGGRLYAGAVASTGNPVLIWSRGAGSEWTPSSEPGFGGANSGVYAFAVHAGALYAGTANADGAQVWSSSGAGWSHVAASGLDNPANTSVRALASFKGRLYAGTSNAAGAQVWAYNGQNWARVVAGGLGDPKNVAVQALAVFGDKLYAGTRNSDGAQIWSTLDGSSWDVAIGDGFGDSSNVAVMALSNYQNQLYAGLENGLGKGGAIWRYDSISWQRSAWAGFSAASNPLDIHNLAVASLAVHDGALYAGTVNDVYGTQIWLSDGSGWWPSTKTGLGTGESSRAARALVSYGGALWAGIENFVDGAGVWYGSPQIELTVVSEPEIVAPPYRIRYDTWVRNTLAITLTGMQAFDTWESVGDCVYDLEGRTHLRWDIGDLGPGESRSHKFTLETHTYPWCSPQVVTSTVRLQGSNLAPMFAFATTVITSGPTPTTSPTPGPSGPFTATFQQGMGGYTGSTDTYIAELNPTLQYCGQTRIRVGDRQRLAGLLRFDVSSLPSAANVASATLRLYGFDRKYGRDISVSLYAISRTVDVCRATWNEPRAGDQWAIAGCKDVHSDRRPDPEVTFSTSGVRLWYDLDVTHVVRDWAGESLANNGFLLLGPTEDSEVYAFTSGEYPEPTKRPMLIVTYYTAPTPATPTSTPTPTGTPTATPIGSITLTGLVYDAQLGPTHPISGATVSALMCVPTRFPTQSLPDGTYSLFLPDLYLAGCDEITLEVWADDYQTWSEAVSVAELQANPERDFALMPVPADTPTPTPTRTPTGMCPDTYEPNDSFGQPWDVSWGGHFESYICSAEDVDYYEADLGERPFDGFNVTLNNLAADYDLHVYDSGQQLIASSTKPALAAESLTVEAQRIYIKVSGADGAFHTSQPYYLDVIPVTVPTETPTSTPGVTATPTATPTSTTPANWWYVYLPIILRIPLGR
jgi:hypothetical protein